ncbi:MAG: CDP-alcohol phosphatidyltransferase family protein [Candidatus Bathyarchaeota archaeon]|jgi:archaetidylinositol phosphate synthase|nr:CDP-alcohol phosphatidyltransferase family protein [Candidatus Bathyarchaeota archaeon]MDP7442831.1 CDP-alcohol phosphatidyltransferase family protein [Candidatus Bathyarchaeota archaeon]|tara:strand:+ start:1358 stop:2062 length:705 start_codon:yes stop_codon:yes gene_type:complete
METAKILDGFWQKFTADRIIPRDLSFTRPDKEALALVSSRLKKKFEEIVGLGVGPLASIGVTPNALTVMGLLASTASAWAYLHWRIDRIYFIVAASFILLSGILDAFDGILARKTGKVTKSGGFFDSVADRYSDAVVLGAIVISGLCDPIWGVSALIGSLMVSYVRARSEAVGVAMIAVGFAERAERMLLLVVATLGAYYQIEFIGYGIIILAMIANLTVVQRVAYFMNEVKTS